MIASMTADHRAQLAMQAAKVQSQLAVTGPVVQEAPQPAVEPPSNGKGRPAPSQAPAKRSIVAMDPISQAKERVRMAALAYKQMKTARFMERHQRLMRGLDAEPFDVRWLAAGVNKLGFVTVWLAHLYVNVRRFLMAHRAGFCTAAAREGREVECLACDWGYAYESAKYCKGCRLSTQRAHGWRRQRRTRSEWHWNSAQALGRTFSRVSIQP